MSVAEYFALPPAWQPSLDPSVGRSAELLDPGTATAVSSTLETASIWSEEASDPAPRSGSTSFCSIATTGGAAGLPVRIASDWPSSTCPSCRRK